MSSLVTFLGIAAIAAVVSALLSRLGMSAIRPLYLSRRRSLVVLAGALMGWMGFVLVVGWAAATFPYRGEPLRDREPTPDWLWQVGAGVAVLGAVLVASAWMSAPLMAETDKASNGTFPGPRHVLVGLACSGLVSIAVATLASRHSAFVWHPLQMAVLCVITLLLFGRHWFRE